MGVDEEKLVIRDVGLDQGEIPAHDSVGKFDHLNAVSVHRRSLEQDSCKVTCTFFAVAKQVLKTKIWAFINYDTSKQWSRLSTITFESRAALSQASVSGITS